MDDEDHDGFDPQKAEFFEALGHATRIRIIRALEAGPMTFSELKHVVMIDSNGLLAFHLGRMGMLVKTEADGRYALTDQGREALDLTSSLAWPAGQSSAEERPRRVVHIRRNVFVLLMIGLVVLAATTGVFVTDAARVGPFQGTIAFTLVLPNAGGTVALYSGHTVIGNVSGGSMATFHVPYGGTISGSVNADPGYVVHTQYSIGTIGGGYTSNDYFNVTNPTSDFTLVLVFTPS